MLRLAKAFPFFNTASDDALAQSFIVPTNGFLISAPTRHGLDNYHGPGTVFQGQLNLQLVKPIMAPCRLRVVFSCLHTMPFPDSLAQSSQSSPNAASSETRPSSARSQKSGPALHTLFEIEHVLVQDESLQARRHTFMFNIKFPRVNMPASMVDGVHSVVYALHGELSFQTTPGNASPQACLSSPAVHVKYLPLVLSASPHYPITETTQTTDPSSDQQLFKAVVESPQRGVCPGELLPLSLTVANASDTELQAVHLSLVRVVSYPALTSSSSSLPSSSPANGFAPLAEPTTVHAVTIPVSKTPNKKSTWQEAIQFKVPANLGLIPTTNKTITPLFKVDYYLSVSLPVASRSTGLASWFTLGTKSPPPVDMSLIRDSAGASEPGSGVAVENISPNSHGRPRKAPVDKTAKTNPHVDRISTPGSAMKWPTSIQLPLVPVIIGTVPYCLTERQLRWPIPNYLDVMDRPCFIRDRFEEEMMQQFQSLETLIAEEEDEDHIERIIEAARKSLSSGESDEDEQRARSKIPARFRDDGGSKNRRVGNSSSIVPGAPPPPPSPPPSSSSVVIMHHTLPGVGRRPMSPKARGLSKEVLLDMHHSKIQQSIHAELENI